MGRLAFVLGLGLGLGTVGCSFIDSFDYRFADAAADSMMRDADVGPPDSGIDSGSSPCNEPCIADAVRDFSADAQGAGGVGWRYLSDDRAHPGTAYAELSPTMIYDAPAWGGDPAPPAVVACDGSTTGPCAQAFGGLIFETGGPGGSDPVLSFTAPQDGTYVVNVEVLGIESGAEVLLTRNGRYDTGAVGTVDPVTPGSFSARIDLFRDEVGLITVRPLGGAATKVSGRVRIVDDAVDLEDCELVLRFQDPSDLLSTECVLSSTVEVGSLSTNPTEGPDGSSNSARLFQPDSMLRVNVPVRSLDYSSDFTVQMWIRTETVTALDTIVYIDWTGPGAGGVRFSLHPIVPMRSTTETLTVGYLFPAQMPAFEPPGISCTLESCFGQVRTPVRDAEWHFYRFVRIDATEETRLCVDGEHVDSSVVPSGADLSNPSMPFLGGDAVRVTFEGAVDDVRIFSRALPCGD